MVSIGLTRGRRHVFQWRSVLLLLVWICFVSCTRVVTAQEEAEAESEPANAVLFPWFSLLLGTLVYYVLTRYASWIPYTAVMFVIGTVLGISAVRIDNTNILKDSLETYWLNIDSEVLLLSFLPGLVANDAIRLDAYLFEAAFWQCFYFAFPMVLAGTCLTACVAFFIFPYGWSFNFAMMFGSILSATDPVAVSALLESVGAPPRLKIHISGESLLNDGSAIVFYTIFSQLFLLELGVPGLGRNIDVAQGFALFFRMSLGAMASGIFFGLGTIILVRILNRRLNRGENVVETATTIIMAYICYFVSDVVWGTSGVIATLTFGLLLNSLGRTMINDVKLLEDFWDLVEHLLNTVLFTLGGLVWGSVIANDPKYPDQRFTAKDWGYLFMLYVFLMVIRYALFIGFFPLTYYLGISTNWKEQFFQSYAGLRGAVGISLAIAIDNIVREAAIADPLSDAPNKVVDTNKLFGMIGGIAFLTLIINATTAGPILRKLGLADATETRKQVIDMVRKRLRGYTIDKMVELLSEKRFQHVNFAVVRHHVTIIQDLTAEELAEAVDMYRSIHGREKKFAMPIVKNVLPYIRSKEDKEIGEDEAINKIFEDLYNDASDRQSQPPVSTTRRRLSIKENPSIIEIRNLYLEVLRANYSKQIEAGEMTGREFVSYALLESVDHAKDATARGSVLNDWEYTSILKASLGMRIDRFNHSKWVQSWSKCVHGPRLSAEDLIEEYDVERCAAFLEAHRHCREVFDEVFDFSDEVGKDAEQVLSEADDEIAEAEKLLTSCPNVELILSHKFCTILLNNAAKHTEFWVTTGLLQETEAEVFLESFQEELRGIDSCAMKEHPGEVKNELERETE